jgi:hypothetical protein
MKREGKERVWERGRERENYIDARETDTGRVSPDTGTAFSATA